MFMVLIDTWWNVNEANEFGLLGSILRFNRYMVECELEQYRKEFELKMVLIDTWWNVNLC